MSHDASQPGSTPIPAPRPNRLLGLHDRITAWPLGRALFSRLVCLQAPYFASIAPRIDRLEPGRCEASIRDRRRVRNHIGTVHAIALCNLAELAAGLMLEASLPATMRWIPKGMEVEYLAKARGTMRATATPASPVRTASEGYALPVEVAVVDDAGATVFRARVAMWVSPKRGQA